MIVKTPSLVLRRSPFGETSQVATLLTRDLGRIQVLAKGIRAKKPWQQGALDLLTLGQSVVYHRRPGELHALAESTPFEHWPALRASLDRVHAGYYLAELARLLTPPETPDPGFFRLACQALAGIERAPRVRPRLDASVLAALAAAGHAPVLDRCALCGRPERAIDRPRLDALSGGLLCGACPAQAAPVAFSRGTLAVLGHLAGGGPPERVALSRAQEAELGGVFAHLTRHLFERPMRMERFLVEGVVVRRVPRPLGRPAPVP